jgi:hypothetical protein
VLVVDEQVELVEQRPRAPPSFLAPRRGIEAALLALRLDVELSLAPGLGLLDRSLQGCSPNTTLRLLDFSVNRRICALRRLRWLRTEFDSSIGFVWTCP